MIILIEEFVNLKKMLALKKYGGQVIYASSINEIIEIFPLLVLLKSGNQIW